MVNHHINTLQNKISALTFEPASDIDIQEVNQILHENMLATLPEDYTAFLHISDGLSYNNIEFFGCRPHDRPDKGYVFPNLISVNANYIPYDFFSKKVVLGQMSESLICYDQNNSTFCVIDRINLSTRREVDKLKELFKILFELRGIK